MKIENYRPEVIHVNNFLSIVAYGNAFPKPNNSMKSVQKVTKYTNIAITRSLKKQNINTSK